MLNKNLVTDWSDEQLRAFIGALEEGDPLVLHVVLNISLIQKYQQRKVSIATNLKQYFDIFL